MKTDGILNLDVVDAAMNAVFGATGVLKLERQQARFDRLPDFMAVLPETFGDCELAVFTVKEQAYPATRETPAEPGGLMPEKVLWRGIDVTSSLTEDEMASIQEQLNEV